jgi:hypothetical protein
MATKSSTWEAAGRSVRVTNLDRVYWPEDGFTKGDLLAYYRDVAPVLLPYIADRPAGLPAGNSRVRPLAAGSPGQRSGLDQAG